MKRVPLDAGKIGHADSYIVKHTQTVKNVLVWSRLHKLSDSNPLDGLRIKNAVYDDTLFLSEEQFQQLRTHTFKNKNLQQAADVFIILCRCRFVGIRVPQLEEVAEIGAKYGGWEQLPPRPLPKFNNWLKLVAAELDLPEKLSSKAGRKTFTDWCFNTLLLSTDSVKVLPGRKSDKGLEVYGRPDERRVAGEMARSQVLQNRKKGAN